MVVLVPPDLGAEIGLDFPSLYAGQRVYSAADAPELPVDEIPARVRHELQPLLTRLRPQDRVAITAGSRGIANIVAILRTCGEAIRERGAEPFIIPAMGSHGGATADGQRDMLAGYGITPETVGMPIISSMDVQQIGSIDDMPVFLSTTALESRPHPAGQPSQTAHRFSWPSREWTGQDLRHRSGQTTRRPDHPQLRYPRSGRVDAARGALHHRHAPARFSADWPSWKTRTTTPPRAAASLPTGSPPRPSEPCSVRPNG